jgi:inorganic phosphate transporter, PiT family
MFRLLSGIFMGWSLGANDSANIFGTAVFSRMVKFKTALIWLCIMIILGSMLQGAAGMHTLSGLVEQNLNTAFITALAAALTVTVMTFLNLPVSTSQAMVGAIIGIGIVIGHVDLSKLPKVFACWVGTPIGAILCTIILYPLLSKLLEKMKLNIFQQDSLLRIGLIVVGCFGAYSLGANNVANVTGIYIETGLLNVNQALIIGSLSICFGAITYSKRVMQTVGEKLVKLDPFSAFVAVLSMSIVLYVYAIVGVPVSSSQAIVGSVLGIGLVKGVKTINIKTLRNIVIGWITTPLISMGVSMAMYIAAIKLLGIS